MPPLDRLEVIVRDVTSGLNPDVQQRALGFLHEWVDAPEQMRSDVCDEIRTAINTHQPKRERSALRAAHKIASERFASQLAELVRREASDRQSANAMKRELLTNYELVRRQGKGFVFFGTARSVPGETEYERARELSREVAILFGSTTYCGAGPGDMDAVARGAEEAGGRIAGVKIKLTAEQSEFEQQASEVFDESELVICDYFMTRKHGLTEPAMREKEEERTGVICLPGGYGSMDEFFEFGNLKLLKKLGTVHPVPVVLMNCNGEYDGVLAFFDRAISDGRIGPDQGVICPDDPEQRGIFRVCSTNAEALDYLADFYSIPGEKREYTSRLRNWRVEPDTIPEGTGSTGK